MTSKINKKSLYKNLDPSFLKDFLRPTAAPLQDARRRQRAGRQDDELSGSKRVLLAGSIRVLDTDGSVRRAFENDSVNLALGEEVEVYSGLGGESRIDVAVGSMVPAAGSWRDPVGPRSDAVTGEGREVLGVVREGDV